MDEDAFAAALAADITRLDARPYAEVGVPMFLIPEGMADDARAGDAALAAALTAMVCAAAKADVASVGTARLVEVLADRHLLGADGPTFSRLSDDPA